MLRETQEQETQESHSNETCLYTHVQAESWRSRDAEEIRNLFYSTNVMPDLYFDHCEAIHSGIVHEGLLEVRRFEIPEAIPDKRQMGMLRQPGQESFQHLKLKFSVAKWFAGIGLKEIARECGVSPGVARVDLYTPEFGGVVIECGNTLPDRITHLMKGVKHFLLVPFMDVGQDMIEVYGFQRKA